VWWLGPKSHWLTRWGGHGWIGPPLDPPASDSISVYTVSFSSSIHFWFNYLKILTAVHKISIAQLLLNAFFTIHITCYVQGGLPPTRHSSHGQNRYWCILHRRQRMLNCLLFVVSHLSLWCIMVLWTPFNVLHCPMYVCKVRFWFVGVFWLNALDDYTKRGVTHHKTEGGCPLLTRLR